MENEINLINLMLQVHKVNGLMGMLKRMSLSTIAK